MGGGYEHAESGVATALGLTAVTRTGNTIRFYKDGVAGSSSTATSDGLVAVRDMWIGGFNGPPAKFSDRGMRAAGWCGYLNSTQVADLYATMNMQISRQT